MGRAIVRDPQAFPFDERPRSVVADNGVGLPQPFAVMVR